MTGMTDRPGTPGSLVRPVALAQTRALRQAILRPHESVEDMAAHEPADAFSVGAFDGEELLAVGFIAPEGGPGSWRLRAMATEEHARGGGIGRAVLDALVGHALARGASRIWCNARTPARSFYERAGFRVTSEEFELGEMGPHFVMER
jgi:GNAT superfamily N-acetyltransferase